MRTSEEKVYVDRTANWIERQKLENQASENAILFYKKQIELFTCSMNATREQLEYDKALLSKTEEQYAAWLAENPE